MPATPALPAVLSVRQVAAEARVNERTVRRWVTSGALPATMSERSFRISRDDLARFLRAGRATGGPDGRAPAAMSDGRAPAGGQVAGSGQRAGHCVRCPQLGR